MKAPCQDCPFRKDTLKGWLGAERMSDILSADSFVCRKKTDKQCAGRMLINRPDNAFVRLAARLRLTLHLAGADKVFTSKAAYIEHHQN
ncbi:DUF6283 family protein [Massilia oculi]|uniref:Uncharacterized protein n=1 Tax=Massilia oculi TaxID=945844 RepID=A0A2S2DCN5_9BURK|nr:DUF6283 family protein [Massilia oculi]AWL03098.1 hypothetical protein DIR46_00565 [Massilia oculi]